MCEEPLGELQNAIAVHYGEGGTHHISAADAVITRADAALAEPVGEGPTGDAAVEAAAELIYNQAMKWAATQPIPSDHINIPAWQQGGNSDAQEVARRTARAALAAKPLVKGPTDEELLELWQGWNLGWDPQKGMVLMPHPAEYARAVLTRWGRAGLADGPAVPEGREPASVVGEPSDENCWQWYAYCPEEGLEMYSEREQAQSAAQSIMGSYEVAAYSDGWHEDMESASWGMLVPVEQAQVVERKTAEPGGEFDEWVKYELRPARYGHQPAPAAEGEVE
jgi:hypothetical protein